jgi:hypothetical protein
MYHLKSDPHPRHTTSNDSALLKFLTFHSRLLLVVDTLKANREHSLPFLRWVNKREAPDYYFGKYRQTSQMEFTNKKQSSNILWISAP